MPEAPFERAYFEDADPDDLAVLGSEHRAGAARSHQRLASARLPGRAAVRVGNPARPTDGWESPHTVVEVVTDDMPFVVDSVTALLARLGYEVHLLLHPVIDGESFVHAEIDRESDPAVLDTLAERIESTLADVRAAVADWQPMRDRALALASELRRAAPVGIDPDEAEEAATFLEFLDEGFTFVGACDDRGDGALGVVKRRVPRGLPGVGSAPHVLTLTKVGERSTVHRAAPLDFVGVTRFDERGAVVGEERFFGLYTAGIYSASANDVPVVRRKIAQVMARAGFPAMSHDDRTLANVLETLPRDEMLRWTADELYAIALRVMRIGERRRVRVLSSVDPWGRFVSLLVYIPRDLYTTPVRVGVLDALERACDGTRVDFSVLLTESVLGRLHVIVQTRAPVTLDDRALEAQLASIARAWTDDLSDALVAARGEEAGLDAYRVWGEAFPAAYQSDVTATEAVADIAVLEARDDVAIRLVGDGAGAGGGRARLELFRTGAPVLLSDVMPVLEHLGVTVVDERPYSITPQGAPPSWIYSFRVQAPDDALHDGGAPARVAELFLGVWAGDIENDGLNRLVVRAGLTAAQVVVLRALVKYLHQAGARFTEASFADTLAARPGATKLLVALFEARFDPSIVATVRAERERSLTDELGREIDAVQSLEEDRILRTLLEAVRALVRTNAYTSSGDAYLSLKLDPASLSFLPVPRPQHEIWVYSARVEAVHLRGGDVARGGIRWSDRRDDFRTEILGLMRAQTEKNAVIVPVGAKGGFVVKRSPVDASARRDEVLACYQTFVRGLLDVTDNLVGGTVLPPEGVVRHDDDDPYLVVAADKGTAGFSDVANDLAREYGFWLDDAFASGGSAGYDHKEMGITSRGAWVSVRAHFRAMGVDADTAPLTVVGIGDMSGDVFGNGLLRSPHVKLVAAFDHRHVFVDPDPDPAASFAERRRLFALPTSSWADYDPAALSPGAGVYPRDAKTCALSDEARRVLGIDTAAEASAVTPDDVVSAILRAPVDLLWNGGIGTFVKAGAETNADVGDRANDAVRIDASELRCAVVTEGGNLGLTQRARVEYALAGGRVNTDAIDNSAGVDCSDHEVNIKILLRDAIDAGMLRADDRLALLTEMTDEVAELVLADNEAQTNALAIAASESPVLIGVHARQIDRLEQAGVLDRALERLPDARAIQERHAAGFGLVAPELAVLLAFSKLELQRALVASDVPDDPYLQRELVGYFPSPIRERFARVVDRHALRREITATVVANAVVNRAGISFLSRLLDETGAPLPLVARAHVIARDVLGMVDLWRAIDDLDLVVPAATQDRMFLAIRRTVERGARWLVRHGGALELRTTVERFQAPVASVVGSLPDLLVGLDAAERAALADGLCADGVGRALAERFAAVALAAPAFAIADVGLVLGVDVEEAARVHFTLADRLRLDWLRDRVAALPRADRWQTEARAALRDDVADLHRELTEAVLRETAPGEPAARIDRWIAAHADAAGRYRSVLADVEASGVFDLATLSAARRELRDLVDPS